MNEICNYLTKIFLENIVDGGQGGHEQQLVSE